MKKIGFILAVLLLAGAACTSPQPETVGEFVVVHGQIVAVAESKFTIVKNNPETGETTTEQAVVVYDSNTRFAVPDGSGIGGPIPKPTIETGLQVEVHGTTKENNTIQAENIIFNAE